MKPSRPVPDWLSIKEAAAYLSVSSTTIRRLRQALDPCTHKPFLVSCQPSPHLILISTASLNAHREAAQDLEFWDGRKLARCRTNAPLAPGRRGSHHGRKRSGRNR